MGILQTLKVINSKRPHQASPITQRRNVLLKKIHEQIEAAKARAENKQYPAIAGSDLAPWVSRIVRRPPRTHP